MLKADFKYQSSLIQTFFRLRQLESYQQQDSSNMNNQQLCKSVQSIRRKIYDDNEFKDVVKVFYKLIFKFNKAKRSSKTHKKKQLKKNKQKNAKQQSIKVQNGVENDINMRSRLQKDQEYFNTYFRQQIFSQINTNFNQNKNDSNILEKSNQTLIFRRNQYHVEIAYKIYMKNSRFSLTENEHALSNTQKAINKNSSPQSYFQEEEKQSDSSFIHIKQRKDSKPKPLIELVREFQCDQ